MSRSGHTDEKSRRVIKQINALGAHIDLLTGDVTVASAVKEAMQQTRVPIVGIIQGAMVLRVSTYFNFVFSAKPVNIENTQVFRNGKPFLTTVNRIARLNP